MEPKPPVGRTEFGELKDQTTVLDAKHEEVKTELRRVVQATQQLEVMTRRNEKQVERQGKELAENTRATNRALTEIGGLREDSKDIIAATKNVGAFFNGVVWIGEWIKKLWPLWAVIGTCYGLWASTK